MTEKGRKIGLALGGGAPRAAAHIGVLQVFKERGLPVDCVAGCSMGAVIGGIYCAGEDMYEFQSTALPYRNAHF